MSEPGPIVWTPGWRRVASGVANVARGRPSGLRRWPPIGFVRMGALRRLSPIDRDFGYDRGDPIDRYYVEGFLDANRDEVRGRVLEVFDDTYTRRFGGARVTRADVLHPSGGNAAATIVADLTDGEGIPSDAFDCVILTQTLLLVWDVAAAVRTVHRILRPGGTALVTVPGGCHRLISEELHLWGDYWRFTSVSARRLFAEAFGGEQVQVQSYGNVLAATAFLHGLAAQDLRQRELDHHDPDFEVTVAVRATKAVPG